MRKHRQACPDIYKERQTHVRTDTRPTHTHSHTHTDKRGDRHTDIQVYTRTTVKYISHRQTHMERQTRRQTDIRENRQSDR